MPAVAVMGSVGFRHLELEPLPGRLDKMSDEQLTRFGRAGASLCRPKGQIGQPARRVLVDQLEEARKVAAPASQGAHVGQRQALVGP
jgi:hypothetical protein